VPKPATTPFSPASLVWYAALFTGVAGLAGSITLLFHVMRAVMQVGGACGSDGQYQVAVACPDGVAPGILLAIFGGLIALGVTMLATWRTKAPSIVLLAWPGLFMSLGFNFLQDGISPADGSGAGVGSIICGVVFEVMGAVPLLFFVSIWRDQWRRRAPRSTARASAVPVVTQVEVASPAASTWVPTSGPLPADEPPEPPEPPVDDLDGGGDPRLVERLQQLADLHRGGDLTDAEFRAGKRAILAGEQ